jgi:lipooligosaccharide transport system ATP-binding protein
MRLKWGVVFQVRMTGVILAEGLSKKFEKLVAVDRVNFDIQEGECFGFLGPNGSGKTTIIRMINCVSPVTSGKLHVLGMDVNHDFRKIKALIGVAPQEDNLDPDFSVILNLTSYARYFGMKKEAATKKSKELLAFMQLSDKTEVKIDKISGGMKRRLIIARALLNDPRVLILDEPTTGLDPQARHLIWEKVRELKKKGVTVVVTTHYMDEAQQLCDRLVIMEKGKILVEGRPADLIAKHVGAGVVEILDLDEPMESALKRLELIYEKAGERVYVYTDDNRAVRAKLLEEFPSANVIIRDATLEDVFLKLTGRGLRE